MIDIDTLAMADNTTLIILNNDLSDAIRHFCSTCDANANKHCVDCPLYGIWNILSDARRSVLKAMLLKSKQEGK